ncbi:MAG TPA: ABC transporter permease [Blastocatellia bacterium]|nr:ABC transporter permease [Blastocatellia bacterium]
MNEWKHEISRRLADLDLNPTREAEIIEELSQHFEDRQAELLAGGATPDEATRAILAELRSSEHLAREISRIEHPARREPALLPTNRRGGKMLEDLWHDLRYGARTLRRTPGFALIAIATLALGIGVSTALFTVFNAFVLKPLPLEDPHSITTIEGRTRDGKKTPLFSYLDYLDYRDRNKVFAGLIAFNKFAATFREPAAGVDEPMAASESLGFGQLVSGNYFSVLGAEMVLGRDFAPEEFRTPDTHPVLVLSYICWEKRFNSDPEVIGQTVKVAGRPFTIIGVTERGFIGTIPDSPQFWIPLMMRDQVAGSWNNTRWLTDRSADSFSLTGRLRPGVTRQQAQADMNLLADQLAQQYPDPERETFISVGAGATFVQLDDHLIPLVAPLLTAVALILLIACANVANLLLARSASRQREIAVRLSLGASRWRLIRQILTESVLLSALGGVAGFLLTIWTVDVLYPVVLAELPLPRALVEQVSLDLGPDYRIFGFALLLSLLAGLAAGLPPAMQASRPSLNSALKDEGSTFGERLSHSRVRNTLVVTQIAVSLTLLIAAGLLVRNLQKARTIDTGLVTNNVVLLQTSLQRVQNDPSKEIELNRQLAARLRAVPGVKAAGQSHRAPLTGGPRTVRVTLAGDGSLPERQLPAGVTYVSTDFFQTLGLRITRGRVFTDQEAQAHAPVVLINESTVRHFWPGIRDASEALGKHIDIGFATAKNNDTFNPRSSSQRREVIGITNDTRQIWVWRKDEMFLYLPLQSFSHPNETRTAEYLVVSVEGDPRTVITAARDEAFALDPNLNVLARRLEDSLTIQMAPFRAVALLSSILGVLALLLASIGLYGVMAFVVSQRTREIGIRLALGAQSRDVISLFLRQGGRLIAIGVVLGLAGGAAISGMLAAVLVDIGQFDPLAFCIMAAFLTAVALFACWIPAQRAIKVDPMEALRCE